MVELSGDRNLFFFFPFLVGHRTSGEKSPTGVGDIFKVKGLRSKVYNQINKEFDKKLKGYASTSYTYSLKVKTRKHIRKAAWANKVAGAVRCSKLGYPCR